MSNEAVKFPVGTQVIVNHDDNWMGAEVVAATVEKDTTWYDVKLLESNLVVKHGDILRGFHDTEYYIGSETIKPNIGSVRILAMRTERTEYGPESLSVASGSSIDEVVADLQSRIDSGEHQYAELPGALETLQAGRQWYNEDRTVAYWLRYSQSYS